MRVAAVTMAAAVLCGCGGGKSGSLATLDLEAAIDNPKTFDLTDIAADIEFVPLDDSNRDGLLGNIRYVAETKDRFYIQDASGDFLFKIFDGQGKFLSTLGRRGRGPDEFMISIVMAAADPDRDILYVMGRMGDMKNSALAYDAGGRIVARNDSVSGTKIAFFDDRLIVMKDPPSPLGIIDDPDYVSTVGTKVPMLEVYTADLKHERTVEVTDKGSGSRMEIDSDGSFADRSNIRSITVMSGSASILSDNGNSLLVKEPMSDTMSHYRNGTPEPAWLFDLGNYAIPANALGVNPTGSVEGKYTIRNVLESDRYIFVEAYGYTGNRSSSGVRLVFDKRDLAAGLSATGGAEGKPGLFLDGLAFTPLYVRGNRLVGHIPALSIVDNADEITHPDLKAIAADIREESNPVIAIVELK